MKTAPEISSRRLSVPGKTFLLGEYVALSGGPSILAATGPRFVLEASKGSPQTVAAFSAASPAGRFLSREGARLDGWTFRFNDPHKGKGGLGASSAQFALLYALEKGVSNLAPESFDWESLLKEYQQCAWSGKGQRPSGADVVAQLCGGLTHFDGHSFRARKLEWRFPNLTFTLLRTGTKLATHEHLKRHVLTPSDLLRESVVDAAVGIELMDQELFLRAVREFAENLADSGLTAEATIRLLDDAEAKPDIILAAKGCGAMGADILAVFHEPAKSEAVIAWGKAKGLSVCGSLEALSHGLEAE
jgi:mevalonate kinase